MLPEQTWQRERKTEKHAELSFMKIFSLKKTTLKLYNFIRLRSHSKMRYESIKKYNMQILLCSEEDTFSVGGCET